MMTMRLLWRLPQQQTGTSWVSHPAQWIRSQPQHQASINWNYVHLHYIYLGSHAQMFFSSYHLSGPQSFRYLGHYCNNYDRWVQLNMTHDTGEGLNWPKTHAHTHTHTRLTAVCPWLPSWAGTRKVTPVWILLKQETVSGSGISWAICKSAPRSKQITTPSPHYSVFLQAGCPSCRPTNSVKALKAKIDQKHCAVITDWPLSQIVNCSWSVCFSVPLERVKCVCIFYL